MGECSVPTRMVTFGTNDFDHASALLGVKERTVMITRAQSEEWSANRFANNLTICQAPVEMRCNPSTTPNTTAVIGCARAVNNQNNPIFIDDENH